VLKGVWGGRSSFLAVGSGAVQGREMVLGLMDGRLGGPSTRNRESDGCTSLALCPSSPKHLPGNAVLVLDSENAGFRPGP
jgi:hypothetical protein